MHPLCARLHAGRGYPEVNQILAPSSRGSQPGGVELDVYTRTEQGSVKKPSGFGNDFEDIIRITKDHGSTVLACSLMHSRYTPKP